MSFAISVTSEDVSDDLLYQQATITEENNADDLAIFTIAVTGFPLNSGNTASVDINFSGSAEDSDFVTAALASLTAALPTGVSISGSTLTFTNGYDGSPISFAIEALDDNEDEGPEDLIATLSNDAIDHGSSIIVGGQGVAIVDLHDDDAVTEFPGGLSYTIAGKGNTGAFLYSIDLESGLATELGPVVVDGEAKAVFYGLALSPATDTLFGVATQGRSQWIVEVNPVNGEVLSFIDVSDILSGTANTGATFDVNGNYYVLQSSMIYSFNGTSLTQEFSISGGYQIDGFAIDPATGNMYFAVDNGSVTDLYILESTDIPATNTAVAITLIGTVNGLLPGGVIGEASIDSLAFDNYGNLWGADNDGTLIKIDPETADVTGGTTLANNEVTGSGVYSLGIGITEDQVFEGNGANDIITGGSGSDILTGNGGDDLFVWTASDDIDVDGNPADGVAVDVITDFRDGGAGDHDALDLSDLLVGEESGNITDYIEVQVDGADIVFSITTDPANNLDVTQTIVLDDTTTTQLGIDSYDLGTALGQTDAINALIGNGSIIVDS